MVDLKKCTVACLRYIEKRKWWIKAPGMSLNSNSDNYIIIGTCMGINVIMFNPRDDVSITCIRRRQC